MNTTIINIGDELLIGQVINTNAAKMSQMLTANGFKVVNTLVVGDDADAIRQSINDSLTHSDVILITGGLGPTKDDITKKVLCDFFHSELYENEEALENVKRHLAARGKSLTEINRQQAWVPRCCTMLNNVLGTAPAMWFEVPGTTPSKVLVSLPGVPFEMENLMESVIIPRLHSHFQTGCIVNKNLLIHGIGESFLSDLIESWETALPANIRLAYLPRPGMTKLRLTARGDDQTVLHSQIDTAIASLYPIAGEYIVGEDFETLPELLAHTMKTAGATLAVAESCTGGAIASSLTALPGASSYFRGGVVSYCNDVKMNSLGVRTSTLDTYSAVSEETVREMVCGVRERLNADYAAATTGVAGPDGGTSENPVGTVWIGIASDKKIITRRMVFPGRRAQIIERACNEVFAMLVQMVRENQK